MAAAHRWRQRSCFAVCTDAWNWICRERTRCKLVRYCRPSIRCQERSLRYRSTSGRQSAQLSGRQTAAPVPIVTTSAHQGKTTTTLPLFLHSPWLNVIRPTEQRGLPRSYPAEQSGSLRCCGPEKKIESFPRSSFGKEEAVQCDLCKQESSAYGSLLCATCAEAIWRLLTIQQDVWAHGGVQSDSKQAGSHQTTWGS